jgi:hypothetical protein
MCQLLHFNVMAALRATVEIGIFLPLPVKYRRVSAGVPPARSPGLAPGAMRSFS